MAYSLMADVQRLFPSHQMSTTSTVKIADVEAGIAETDEFRDARLRGSYTLPIADAEDLLTLRLISSRLVGQLVWDVLYAEAREAEDPGVPVQGSGKGWERRAMALLKELAPERAALSADSAPRSGIGGGTFVTGYHEDGDTAIAPPVSMADEF